MSALGAAILGRREKQTTVYDDDEPETSAFPVQMNLNHEECPFPRPAVINFESARYRKLKSLIDVDISGARGAFGQMRGVQSFGQAEPWVPASAYLVNSRCESLRKYPKYWLEVKLTNGRSFFVGCVHKKGKRGEKEFRSYWSFPKVHLTHHLALQNAKDLEVETALLRDERAVDHAQEPTTSNKRSREQEGEHDGLADAKEAVVNKRVRIDNGDGDELMAVCDQRAHIGGTGDSEPSALHYTRQTVKGLLAKIQTGAMRVPPWLGEGCLRSNFNTMQGVKFRCCPELSRDAFLIVALSGMDPHVSLHWDCANFLFHFQSKLSKKCKGEGLTALDTAYLKAALEAIYGTGYKLQVEYYELLRTLPCAQWPGRLNKNMRASMRAVQLKVEEAYENDLPEIQNMDKNSLQRAIHLLFPGCVPSGDRTGDHWLWNPPDMDRDEYKDTTSNTIGVIEVLEFVQNQRYIDEPQDDDEHNDVGVLQDEIDVMGLQVGDMWNMTSLRDVAEEIMKKMGLKNDNPTTEPGVSLAVDRFTLDGPTMNLPQRKAAMQMRDIQQAIDERS